MKFVFGIFGDNRFKFGAAVFNCNEEGLPFCQRKFECTNQSWIQHILFMVTRTLVPNLCLLHVHLAARRGRNKKLSLSPTSTRSLDKVLGVY